jgi:hypothetical protein
MYKLIFNEQQQVVGYTFINEQQEGDVVFLAQDLPLVKEYLQVSNLQEYQELHDIQAWLQANDYKINKHLLGEYEDNDPRWTNYLQERQVKLARYNELEQLIAQAVKAPFDLSLLTPIEIVEQEPLQNDTIEDVIIADEVTDQVVEDTEYIV